MTTVNVKLDQRSYPILIEPGLMDRTGVWIQKNGLGSNGWVITDDKVHDLYGVAIKAAFQKSGITPFFQVVPQGEKSKSIEKVTKIHTQLIEKNIKRDSWVLALGGGVVGDLAGFVAATYLRGIPLIQMPTTLLAQVDSSVGGKVGINHPLGKNLIGSFYQPQAVLIDPNVLFTLEQREIWAGLGEVIKYGIITDPKLFDKMESNLDTLIDLSDLDLMVKIIGICCEAKAHVVEQDEKESGLRRILNFGHTLGHAIEAVTNFKTFRHGEAIVHGMRWAVWVSLDQGFLSEDDFRRIDTLLKRFPIPLLPDDVTSDALMAKVQIDKKQTEDGLILVLVDQIGHTQFHQPRDIKDLITRGLHVIRK